MRKLGKVLVAGLGLMLTMVFTTPAFATTDTFKVTAPSSIAISLDGGGTINQSYNVTVQGDIASDKRIKVIPSSSFNLSTTGKSDIPVTVTQDKQSFAYDEINGANGLTVQGTLSTSDKVTAGHWTGSFAFDINIEGPVVYTINHYQQNIENDEYTLAETEICQVYLVQVLHRQ